MSLQTTTLKKGAHQKVQFNLFQYGASSWITVSSIELSRKSRQVSLAAYIVKKITTRIIFFAKPSNLCFNNVRANLNLRPLDQRCLAVVPKWSPAELSVPILSGQTFIKFFKN